MLFADLLIVFKSLLYSKWVRGVLRLHFSFFLTEGEDDGEQENASRMSGKEMEQLALSALVGIEALLAQVPHIPGIEKDGFAKLFEQFHTVPTTK